MKNAAREIQVSVLSPGLMMKCRARRSILLFFSFIALAKSFSAQESVAWQDYDPSALEIKPVAKRNPRAITSMDLLTIRDVASVQISPDGRNIAYVVTQAVLKTNAYRTAVFVVGTEPGSLPINLGNAGPPCRKDESPKWSPDGKYITYRMKKNDTCQIWRWRRDGGKPDQLTHNANYVLSYRWQPDGSRIVFSTTESRRSGEFKDELRRVAERGIVFDNSSITASAARPIAEQAIAAKIVPNKSIWVYEFATGRERKATPQEEALYTRTNAPLGTLERSGGSYSISSKVSPDGKHVAHLIRVHEVGKLPYYGYAISIKKSNEERSVELVPPSTLSIRDLWWSNDGSMIYFTQALEEGGTALYVKPLSGGVMRRITETQDLLTSISFDNAQDRVACLRQNSTTPPEIAVFNLKDGVLRSVANVNPEFQNLALSVPTKLSWTNKYGHRTFGYLLRPLDYQPGKSYPLIVTTYRASGFLRGAVGDEFPIQVFAASGFAVLAFDAGPAIGHKPGDFRTKMLHWYYPMASLETGIKMLVDMGIVDPERKGLTGLSYGSEITEFTISHSDLFQVASTGGPGARDPIFYYLSSNSWRQTFKQWGLDGPPERNAFTRWQELSPALNSYRIKAPLLIQAADSEYLWGMMLYTSLREARKPVELIVYANEGHIKNQPKHKYEIYERNVDWMNFWLQNKEDSDPAKAEQYSRWRKMKADWEKVQEEEVAAKSTTSKP